MSDIVYITRQPITDAEEKLFGYELSYYQVSNEPSLVATSMKTSARLLVNVLEHFDLSEVAIDKPVVVRVAPDFLSVISDTVPPGKVILEVQPAATVSSDLMLFDQCQRLKLQGYSLAIAEYDPAKMPLQFLEIADYASFDVLAQSVSQISAIIATVRNVPLKFIARNVRTREEFQQCKVASFDLYTGQYFVEPETLSANAIEPNALDTVNVFKMVISRAELYAIEEAIKRNPALCYQLIRLVNSSYYGLAKKVKSVFEAINILGYNGLWRWLAILIFAGMNPNIEQRVLLNTAMVRGRLMELLGQHVLTSNECDELFMIGIFSLLDALLEMPLEKALRQLSLSENISDTLIHRKGKYLPFYELALSFEKFNSQQTLALARELKIDLTNATQAHMDAIKWSHLMLV